MDLATTGEVQLVERLGIDPALCIHTHPIKRDRDIRNALEYGVRTFVADNPDEVRKFKRYGERAALLLRVSFRSPGAVCDLSRKFGCDPEDAIALARLAASLGVPVQGFSFHVGSQAADALKHVEAIEACASLIAAARREKLGKLDTLDIGGGFPIDYLQHAVDIRQFCAPIRAALAKLPRHVRVLAEPGRFIAGPSAIGVASVMGRARARGTGGTTWMTACMAPTAGSCMTTPAIQSSRCARPRRCILRCSLGRRATALMSSRRT